jgi:RNA recognition motif-containing protein
LKDDFRLFVGDLGNEVTDEALARAFSKYTTLQKARIIRDKRSGKTKGYGFVSFKGSDDFIKAMREMNGSLNFLQKKCSINGFCTCETLNKFEGKYIGNRPIKLRKSNWQDRNIDVVKKKEAEKQRMGFR